MARANLSVGEDVRLAFSASVPARALVLGIDTAAAPVCYMRSVIPGAPGAPCAAAWDAVIAGAVSRVACVRGVRA